MAKAYAFSQLNRKRMDPYTKFDCDLRSCTKCEGILRKNYVNPCASADIVEPRPIVSGIRPKPILLIGQAPGLKEYETRKPFQGDAGKKIRKIFREVGVDFEPSIYSSAVVKCYPGRKPRSRGDGSEDIRPGAEMINNCRPFLERQILLVNPKVIVTLGKFPLEAYLRLSGQSQALLGLKLENYVGKCQHWQGRVVVFFPHTSGGSFWLNPPSHKQLFEEAKQLLQATLVDTGIIAGAQRKR
jgi:uracil-DNA glycosylase family 4